MERRVDGRLGATPSAMTTRRGSVLCVNGRLMATIPAYVQPDMSDMGRRMHLSGRRWERPGHDANRISAVAWTTVN
jgi:hypothetical protein